MMGTTPVGPHKTRLDSYTAPIGKLSAHLSQNKSGATCVAAREVGTVGDQKEKHDNPRLKMCLLVAQT